MEASAYLPVTVDKSHLVTIGERLYSESIELIRELVNNAYDADATVVRVTVSPDSIVVEDNGTGMDEEGLKQYFVIGSQEKLFRTKSPVFKRDRIGQFGIGKFATLSACSRFVVLTQKEGYAARVTFDKEEWSQKDAGWKLPMDLLPYDSARGDGTTVTLLGLTKKFEEEEVERRLMEGVPLKAPHFSVYLNGKQVHTKSLSGHRIPIMEGTEFGVISGEVVILPASLASTEGVGIEIKVKQATIRRELFGAESWGKHAMRLRGEVYADFLPVTSDRTGFLLDSPQYRAFSQTMRRFMETQVRQTLSHLAGQKEKRAASRALQEALERILRALVKNPDFSPFGPLPVAGEGGKAGAASGASRPGPEAVTSALSQNGKKEPRKKSPKVKRLTPDAVVRRLKMGHSGISCCLDHFGEDGSECFTDGTTVYINRDHPLYKREAKKKETHTMHIARLLTQEISLMKDPRHPRQAFERQSRLLRDAFIDGEE